MPPSATRTRLPGAQVPEGPPQVGQRPSPSGPIARPGPYRFRAGAPLPSAAGHEAQGFLSGIRAQYRQRQERGYVPRSFPLSESCARCRSLRYRPLALDSLRALRSGDVAEAALVAVWNIQGRFGAGDDTQKILKSLDELRVHGFGRDVNLRTVIDDAARGACSCVGRKGLRGKVHIEHDLDPVRTSLPARLDIVDGRLPNPQRGRLPIAWRGGLTIGQRNEVGFAGHDHPRGQRQADGVFALEEDPLAEFPTLEPQPAQLARVFDVPLHGVKVAGRLVVVFVVGLEPTGPLAILFSRHDPGEPGDPDKDSVAFRGHIGTPSCRLTITPPSDTAVSGPHSVRDPAGGLAGAQAQQPQATSGPGAAGNLR